MTHLYASPTLMYYILHPFFRGGTTPGPQARPNTCAHPRAPLTVAAHVPGPDRRLSGLYETMFGSTSTCLLRTFQRPDRADEVDKLITDGEQTGQVTFFSRRVLSEWRRAVALKISQRAKHMLQPPVAPLRHLSSSGRDRRRRGCRTQKLQSCSRRKLHVAHARRS